MSLYAKRLEKGRFVWPSVKDAIVSLTASQLACLLEPICNIPPAEAEANYYAATAELAMAA